MTKWKLKRFATRAILGSLLALTITTIAHGQQRGVRPRQFQRVPCPPPYSVAPENCPPGMTIPNDLNGSVPAVPDSGGSLRMPTDSEPQSNNTESSTNNSNSQSVDQQLQNAQQPLSPETQQQFSTARADVSRSGNFGVTTAPNMIGDFIGFTNSNTFITGSADFALQSLSIPVNTGSFNSSSSFTFFGSATVPDPAGIRSPFSLGNDITVNLNSDGTIDQTTLSPSDRAALQTFLNRDASVNASATSGSQAPTGTVDLGTWKLTNGIGGPTLTTDSFKPGGLNTGVNIDLPRAGDTISRFKASEQTSPIPRDRVLFNYSVFNSVVGPGGTQGVHRFVPGFEKTFNDGYSSVEFRMPFASTFDSNQTATNGAFLGSRNTELGNLSWTLKQIIAQSDNFAVSGGLSMILPTADDLVYQTEAYTLRRKSQSIQLAPFLGSLWTPSDRAFFQTFVQTSFDTNGEQVVITDRVFGASGGGVLQDATKLYADFSSGYWFYRDESATRPSQVSGLAGILELHYNQTLQGTDYINTTVGGNTFQFGQPGVNFSILNLTAGSTIELGKQSTLTAAYVAPLTRDRQFTSEFQVLFSYYFDRRGSPFRIPSAMRTR